MNAPVLANLRRSYEDGVLLENSAPADPLALAAEWIAHAVATSKPSSEPNAIALATADARTARPSCRIVLAKHFDSRGLVFFTNYDSRKAAELEGNPWAAATFWWDQRSIRIEGRVVRTSPSESDAYFAMRPVGSRIGAWASQQSSPISSRDELEAREAKFKEQFAAHIATNGESGPPRPPNWGGYRIVPDLIEFWQGRPSRLHDRLEYRRSLDLKKLQDDSAHSSWTRQRLSP